MVAQPRRLKAANALTGVKYSSHNVRFSIVAARACDTMATQYAATRARRKEKAAWRVSPLAQNEPSMLIGGRGGAHNWPALAAIEMDDPVRTCVSM